MEKAALTKNTIANILTQEQKDELTRLLMPYADNDLLVTVIGLFDQDNRIVDVDVTSPFTLEEYQKGGYMEIYHTVGAVKALL